LGPEKGVTHLACSAIINAIWDLWGRLEQKPVWKLLTDMEPEVSLTKIYENSDDNFNFSFSLIVSISVTAPMC
jgi:L-alanine-DL-glutamate epimerase-like enolase superfamily enzyme